MSHLLSYEAAAERMEQGQTLHASRTYNSLTLCETDLNLVDNQLTLVLDECEDKGAIALVTCQECKEWLHA